MFSNNLISKFTLIFIFFSFYNCFGIDTQSLQENSVKQKYYKTSTPYTPEKIHKIQIAYLNNDSKFLSPSSKTYYISIGSILNHNQIKNPLIQETIINQKVLYSPFVHFFKKDRRDYKKFKNINAVISLPSNAFSEYTLLQPETAEEKQQRKQRQHNYFLSINNVDVSTYDNLEEKEALYWAPYWNYIKLEKEKILLNQRQKIRPEELEDIATAGPLTSYQSFKINGTLFYYHLDFLDFSLKDSLNRTNKQRLSQGLNPIGADGLSMEIHHLTMFNDSLLVLLSRTGHEGGPLKKATNDKNATFHPQPTYYGRTKKSDIDRPSFTKTTFMACIELGRIATAFEQKKNTSLMPVDSVELDAFFQNQPEQEEQQFYVDQVLTEEETLFDSVESLEDSTEYFYSIQTQKFRKNNVRRKLLF